MRKQCFIDWGRTKSVFLCVWIISLGFCAISIAEDGPPPYPAPPLDPGGLQIEELRILDQGLLSIMLEQYDLSFKKDYIDDPFRLDVVQRALDYPLSLVDWNYGWDAFLLEQKSVSDIIGKAAIDLDSQNPRSMRLTMKKRDRLPHSRGIPKDFLDQILILELAMAQASAHLEEKIFSSMNKGDREFLSNYILCRFLEDDSPDRASLECPEEEEYGANQRFLDIMLHYDVDTLLTLSQEMYDLVADVIDTLVELNSGLMIEKQYTLKGRNGLILIGTSHDDVWYLEESPTVIIDPGGNDVYHGGVAVAGNLVGEENPLVSVVIDLAGDDTYLGGEDRSNGSGILGIAMHFDLAGNDTYRANMFSQGCGIFGVGILEDRAGDDMYQADLLVQGAGAIGLGLLQDLNGCDNYHAAIYAQGFGYTRGWGMLTDRDGYDCYYAGGKYDAWPTWGPYILSCSQGYAFGIRPGASGGVGIIHDRNGKDFYSAEVFSQGGSYWYGLGAMIDDNGDDKYSSQVYSQGAGVHLSTGIILDRAGNDCYTCDHQCQGFAHDLSVGWLIDEAGNDNYSSKANAQGCAVTNSVAGLIDKAGDDGYLCANKEKGASYGETTRGYGNIGIQIDMMGKDSYSYDVAYDGAWWNIQSWYTGIDVGENWWKVEKDENGNEKSRTLIIPGVDKE